MKYTYLLALAGVAVAASTGFSQTAVPITNNSFETPVQTSGNYTFIYGPGGSTSTLPGWTVSSGGALVDVQYPSPAPANIDGKQFIEDFILPGNFNGAVNLSQTLTTSFVAGDTYTLTAYAGTLSGEAAQTGDSFFIANSSGTILASTLIAGTTPGTLSQFTVPFVSTGLLGDTGAIEVGFAGVSQGSQSWMQFDNFALTATPAIVPEPSSIAIAALGGFGLLGLVRRRRA